MASDLEEVAREMLDRLVRELGDVFKLGDTDLRPDLVEDDRERAESDALTDDREGAPTSLWAPPPPFDYRELLRKYIGHVGNSEGVDFTNATYREPEGDSSFTDAEWAELRALAGRGEEDEHEREIWREKLADHAEAEAARRVDAQTFARADLHARECRVAMQGRTLVEVSTLCARNRSWACPCGETFRAEGNG